MSNDQKFQQNVQDYLEGRATPEQFLQLNEQLRSDPAARRAFREMLNLDSALMETTKEIPRETVEAEAAYHEESCPRTELEPQQQQVSASTIAKSGNRAWGSLILLIAASLLVVVGMLTWFAESPEFAIVEYAAGAQGLSAGMTLGAESHFIQTGTVQLVTRRGTRIVIEAPALFYFESAQRLQLKHGRLAADVPLEAHGFTVITPTGQAIDLGTKFGVDMPEAGEAEIHVFQGEVVAQSIEGGNLQNLRDSQAFRLQSAVGTPSSFRSGAFIQPGEVDSLSAALQAGQPKRSQLALQELRDDPNLIALLDFEDGQKQPGKYRSVQGRWPGSQAAEFVNVGDHMKLDVGGERLWSQLTLAAWVRLDHLGEPYHSLLHTDGWEDTKKGQVHWMVTRLTTMRLALRDNKLAPDERPNEGFPDSQTSVLPEQGRWVHLAAVYDADKKTVRFYFNGQFDSESRLSQAFPARLGPAQIGNWNTNDRTLSGRIDEMLILGRTMSDAEMEHLFAAGNPYR
ncbi:FecR protein [Bremerella volcania]|uniref:FecR protein n=1 Tax=Bremerella volcania TaxID=2527984 RepID=A0A518C860_9BACT|nr:LamG-like jellyroll fold domain-containing protein [Bremerella volcania]QDU75411.1 FecR protein [Bremerella volcania]